MGKEVVYCARCGKRLLEEEFDAQRAFEILNRYACTECKEEVIAALSPEEKERFVKTEPPFLKRPASGLIPARKIPSPPPVGPKAPSSGRFRRERIGTSKRLPQVPGKPESKKQNNAFLIGLAAAIGIALILLLIFWATRRGDRTTRRPPLGPIDDPDRRARNAAAERAYENLAAQISQDPSAVESHLQEVVPLYDFVPGTRSESRLAALERDLRGLASAKEERIALVRSMMEEVRALSDDFRRFDRRAEIRRILFEADAKASEPLAFGRFTIRLAELADQVRQATQRGEFAVGRRADHEANRVQAQLETHFQAKEHCQARDLIADFGRRYEDHAALSELRSRALRIREDSLKIHRLLDAFKHVDLAGWIAVDPRAGRSWRIEGGQLQGKSSHPPADLYGDHLAFVEGFRDMELAIEVDADRPDALLVMVHAHAGTGEIQREGLSLPSGKTSGAIPIAVDSGTLSGPTGERAVPETARRRGESFWQSATAPRSPSARSA